MDKPDPTPWKRLETKLNVLMIICVVQSILLTLVIGALSVQQLLPSYPTLLMVLVPLIVLAYVFRSRIPGWLGSLGRLVFAQMLTPKSDSFEDN